MKTLKNKIAAITIAIFFILSMTVSMTITPNANAHTPPQNVPTNAYVICTPGTVGVGQYFTIVAWLDRFSPTNGGLDGQLWDGWSDKYYAARRNQHNHWAVDMFKRSCQ